jgi:hypothetical protein
MIRKIKCNVDTTNINYTDFEGVKHMVIPVIMAQEGVMNRLFYPAEEFDGWANTWDGVPVPINHPEIEGVAVSARSPRIQELNSVGYVFNSKYEDKKLKGEIYLNLEKVKKLNADYLIQSFESGEIMEVSTGLYSNVEMVSGKYGDDEYDAIVRNIRPDHLALLPNTVGACSIEDGCGASISVNSCQCGGVCGGKKNSQKEISKLLNLTLEKKYNDLVYIIDIYDNSVIYEFGKNRSVFKESYAINDDNVVILEDDAQEVIQKTSYQTLNLSGGNYMTEIQNEETKEEETKEEETTEEVTEEVTEEATEEATEEVTEETTEETAEETTEEVKENEVSVAEEEEKPKEEKETETEEKEIVENQLIDNEKKEYLENQSRIFDEKKQGLKKALIDNKHFTAEEVETFPFSVLEKINNLIKPKDYSGNGSSLVENKEQYKPTGFIERLQEDK